MAVTGINFSIKIGFNLNKLSMYVRSVQFGISLGHLACTRYNTKHLCHLFVREKINISIILFKNRQKFISYDTDGQSL